jgi:hypothetical protein
MTGCPGDSGEAAHECAADSKYVNVHRFDLRGWDWE